MSSSLERPDIYSSESAMLVVVAGGERAEAILLPGGRCSIPEDERASAALRFLVRGGIVKAVSATKVELSGYHCDSGKTMEDDGRGFG